MKSKIPEFVFDPNSPEPYEVQMDRQFPAIMKAVMAEKKRERGRDQNRTGEYRKESISKFLSAFPPEVANIIEQRIKNLKTIKRDGKFMAEAIHLLVDMFMIGAFQGADHPDQMEEYRKKLKAKTQS